MSLKALTMEVFINDFPVDIVIDGRICLEVDGPTHYLQPAQYPDPKNRATESAHGDSAISVLPPLPGERRAKDRFIDCMLEQYGYRVVEGLKTTFHSGSTILALEQNTFTRRRSWGIVCH